MFCCSQQSIPFRGRPRLHRALLFSILLLGHGPAQSEVQAFLGDSNGDNRQDVYLRMVDEGFIQVPGVPGGVVPLTAVTDQVLLERRADGGFDHKANLSAPELEQLQTWPRAPIDARVDDYNADGTDDILLNDLGAELPGARDYIIFRGLAGPAPVLRELDAEFVAFNEDFIGILMTGARYVLDNLETIGRVCTGGRYVPLQVPRFDRVLEDTFDLVTIGYSYRCTSTMPIRDIGDFSLDAISAWIAVRRVMDGQGPLADVLTVFETVYGVRIGADTDSCLGLADDLQISEADCTDALRLNNVVAAYLRGVEAAPASVPSISISLRATPAPGFFGFKHLSVANSRAYAWLRAGPSNPLLALVGPDARLEKARNFETRAASDEISLSVPVAYAFVPGQSTDSTWAMIEAGYDAYPRPAEVSYCAFPEAGIAPDGTTCLGHNSNSFAKGLLDWVPALVLQEARYIYRGKRRLELFPLSREIYPGYEKPVDFNWYGAP